MNRIYCTCAAVALFSGTGVFASTYSISALEFSTATEQSSFGSGAAAVISDSVDVTTSWDESFTLGGTTDLGTAPNPLWETLNAAYVAANSTYSAANSAYSSASSALRSLERAYSDCLGGTFGNSITCAPVKVPIAGAIVAKAAAKETRDGALSVRNAAYNERQTQPRSLDLGEGGAEAGVTTRGTVGVELAYSLNAGSVKPELSYAVSADVPKTVAANEAFSLVASSELTEGSVNSLSPRFEASISQIVDIELDAYGKVCAVDCIEGSTKLINIDEKVELVSIDPQEITFFEDALKAIDPTLKLSFPTGTGVFQVFKGTPLPPTNPPVTATFNGIALNPPGALPPLVELAAVTAKIPLIDTVGEKDGDKVTSEGSDTILNVQADVDGIISTLSGGTLPPGGIVIPFGPAGLNAGVTLDVFDIKAGPKLDIFQEFEIDSRLMVNLKANKEFTYTKFKGYETKLQETCIPFPFGSDICFSVPVPDLGKPIFETVTGTAFVGAWDDLPNFLIGESTKFTPTFYTEASLRSKFGLQFALAVDLLLGKGAINAGPLTGSFGPLLSETFTYAPEFARFDIFDEKFDLLGFNEVEGDAFTIWVDGDPEISAVPLSASGIMLLSAFSGFCFVSRRRIKKPV